MLRPLPRSGLTPVLAWLMPAVLGLGGPATGLEPIYAQPPEPPTPQTRSNRGTTNPDKADPVTAKRAQTSRGSSNQGRTGPGPSQPGIGETMQARPRDARPHHALQAGGKDAEASMSPSSRAAVVWDGARAVRVQRLDVHRIRWDGFYATVDRHALVWLRGPARPELFDELGVRVVGWPSRTLQLARVQGRPNEDGLDVALRLQDAIGPEVKAVLPDLRLAHRTASISVPPDDPRYAAQWFFERIGIEGAWSLETGSADLTIVVVDNGCDASHPDLADKLDPGRDVVDQDDDPSFEPNTRGNEHGTACAGLAAAATDNGVGVAGACPACRVRCVRMLTSNPSGTPLSRDVAAFEFALQAEADVVSNSWGFVEPVPVPAPLRAIIERVLDEGRGGTGAVVVFAAGNDNRTIGADELQAIPGVLTVGATNNFDEATPFSNRGPSVDVVAPTGTLAPDLTGPDGQSEGDYTSFFGGTSSAAPIVAGVVGLLLSAEPELTASEVGALLRQTAAESFFATPGPDGHDALYGYGLIRPEAALRELLGLPPESVDASVPMTDGGPRADAGPSDPEDMGPADRGPAVGTGPDASGCTQNSAQATWLLGWGALGLAWRRRRVRSPQQ
jgi:serine protease